MQERWHLLCLNDSLTSLPPPGAPGQLQQAQVLGSPSPFAVATHQGWGSLGMSCDGRESPPPEPWLSGVGSSRGAAGRQQLPCRSISAAQDRSLGSGPTVSEMSQWSVPCPTCWGGFVTCPPPSGGSGQGVLCPMVLRRAVPSTDCSLLSPHLPRSRRGCWSWGLRARRGTSSAAPRR